MCPPALSEFYHSQPASQPIEGEDTAFPNPWRAALRITSGIGVLVVVVVVVPLYLRKRSCDTARKSPIPPAHPINNNISRLNVLCGM